MAIGALVTMAFFFAYTVVSTPTQDVGFSCAIAFCLNIYYGTLYAVSSQHQSRPLYTEVRILYPKIFQLGTKSESYCDQQSLTVPQYTPEVLPSAHRATGNGIAVGCNRIMGIISAVVSSTANTATVVPVYICAALFLAMAGVSVIFPFEPYGRRSS